MIPVKKIFDAVSDSINTEENGELSLSLFQRLSDRAELRLIDYLSGDVENQKPPFPYTSQKLREWLTPLIVRKKLQVVNGIVDKPADWYMFEDSNIIGSSNQLDCETKKPIKDVNPDVQIKLVDAQVFSKRKNSFIKLLRPSPRAPLATMVGTTIEFAPADTGSIVLSYIRYPKFAVVKTKKDDQFNQEIIDESASINYEWGLWALDPLTNIVVDLFADHIREGALKQMNAATGKLVRDTK